VLLLPGCFSDEPSKDQNMKSSSNTDSNAQSNPPREMKKSHFNSDDLLITEESNKMKILTEYKKLMLDEKYERAIALLPDLEKEIVENVDKEISKEMALVALSSSTIFPLIMLGQEAESLKKLDEIIQKYSDGTLDFIVFSERIIILSRLNRTDEIITECQKRLQTENASPWRFFTLFYLIQAYLVKRDYNNAKDYIAEINEFFTNPNFWKSSGEIETYGEIKEVEELLKFASFFIENLHDTPLEFRFDKTSPTRPVVVPYDKSKIHYKLNMSVVVFSKHDGCEIVMGDLGKYLKKFGKKEIYDQFIKEMEDLNEPLEDPFMQQLKLQKK
jgi:tetratricopeptide (TPR) repeat protein